MGDNQPVLLQAAMRVAHLAGDRILAYFNRSPEELQLRYKADHSIVTIGDMIAHEMLVEGLQRLDPEIPILSEEGEIPDYEVREQWQTYWLLDPLDGTRGFTQGCAEFSVNIALIQHHQPLLGVVYAPFTHLCYFARRGCGAFKQDLADVYSNPKPIHARTMDEDKFSILIGRYTKAEKLLHDIQSLPGAQLTRLNSSLKFCMIAEGAADCYPRMGDTSEWDTAAAHCVLEAAGGKLVDLWGQPLQYNAKRSLINPAFLAMGDASQQNLFMKLLSA